jgi:hypothetical protein
VGKALQSIFSVRLDGPVELVANRALFAEYEKYAQLLEAEYKVAI